MKHSNDLTHILWDLGRMALAIAIFYGVIIAVVKLATRSKKSGNRKQGIVEGFNRQRRRQEQAMNKRKRHR